MDAYRRRFAAAPETFTNPVLLGSLLVPLGFSADWALALEGSGDWLGMLPVARKDVERLVQLLSLQRRLRDPNLSPRAARGLMSRGAFTDALTWLDIHGHDPDAVARWRSLIEEMRNAGALPAPPPREASRRRRRRPRRPPPQQV